MINEELYEMILRKRGIKAGFTPDIEKDPQAKDYELSAGQMGMWFLQQLRPDSPVYNNPSAMRLEGKLNFDALCRALTILTQEFETLRTGFRVIEGKPVQYLKNSINVQIKKIDYTGKDEEAVRQKLNELARETFNLEEDDLFRVYLLSVSEDRQYLLINIHHIISDGWSKGILLQKLSAIYETLDNNREWYITKSRAHYREYVRWQTDWLSSEAGKKALCYWEDALKDRPPVLTLASDKVREKVQSGKGGITEFLIEEEVYQRLLTHCKNNSLSPFIFLLGVMNLYLYKYTASKDILIGTPIAGRNRREFEDISGFFVNCIVLRNQIDPNMSFFDFIDGVKKNAIKAYQNQDIPFHLLVEKLNPVRELSYSPLFQVMMQFDNSPVPKRNLGKLKLAPLSLDTGVSQVDLSVTFWEDGNVLKGTFEWDSALFDQERTDSMIHNWKSLLVNVLNQPKHPIKSYQILDEQQYQKMVYDWNDTEYALSGKSVLGLLSENALRRGSEAAVIHGEKGITYRELEENTDRISGILREKGVKKGRYVVICLESSIEFIIAVYSILKAGGVVVPIDTTYPKKRIQSMMEELPEPLIITAKKDVIKLILYKENLLTIEKLMEEAEQEKVIPVKQDEESPLCLIFTSGSTGNPKGVLLSYQSMNNLVKSFVISYDVTEDDHIMSISGIASASFIGEILPAISVGALLVLPSMETVLDVKMLGKKMEQLRITILSTVPSMIGKLNQSGLLPKCTRLLLSGGESLLASHIDRISHGKIANGYGLTESGICNTYKLTDVEQMNPAQVSNVGKPVINNKIYVLDEDKIPVPPYIQGDIYVGGISLSLGYLNHEELTKERFIENPFAEGRLLKTGDTGYFLPDGDLFFMGRRDRQVQLRGFRIELSEIERALKAHAGIKETAAVLVNKEQEECLAVYYTTEDAVVILGEQVTYWLKEQLPAYMVPKYCIRLEKMPYNHNGKYDYKSLPSIEGQVKNHNSLKEQPQTEAEKMVAEIWKMILKSEDVGTQDNFFDIGGHSLLLTQVLYELKKTGNSELRIVDLFKYPTINQLAAFLSQPQEERKEMQAKERGVRQRSAYSKFIKKNLNE